MTTYLTGRHLDGERNQPGALKLLFFRLFNTISATYTIYDGNGNPTAYTDATEPNPCWPDPAWPGVDGSPAVVCSALNVGAFFKWQVKVNGGAAPYALTSTGADPGLGLTIVQTDTGSWDVKAVVQNASVIGSLGELIVTDSLGNTLDLGSPVIFAANGAIGTVQRGVLIPDSVAGGFHPHLLDIYTPAVSINPNRVLVLLHGGGGGQASFARQLGITNSMTPGVFTTNWGMFNAFQFIAIIPQGQACVGNQGPYNPNGVNTISVDNPTGVATWSNNYMWAGDNPSGTVQFLKDLSTYIVNTYAMRRVLCGFSNGGFMCNRMIYEAPGYFHHYCMASGTAAAAYFGAALPPVGHMPPVFQQIGKLDATLMDGTGTQLLLDQWPQQITGLSQADVDFPNLSFTSGEVTYEMPRRCAAAGDTWSGVPVTTSIKIGTQDTYTSGSGNYVLQILSQAGHGLGGKKTDGTYTHQQCTGRRVITDWLSFNPTV